MKSLLKITTIFCSAVLISACGGGGGGGGESAAPVDYGSYDPSDFSRSTYDSRKGGDFSQTKHSVSGLDSNDSNAKNSDGETLTGANKRVGIFEVGLYVQNDIEFVDKDGNTRMGEALGFNWERNFKGWTLDKMPSEYYCEKDDNENDTKKVSEDGTCPDGYTQKENEGDHSLAAASIIAGTKNGMARGAKIYGYQVGNFVGQVSYGNGWNKSPTYNLSEAYRHAQQNNLIAINNSYGATGSAQRYANCRDDSDRTVTQCDNTEKDHLNETFGWGFLHRWRSDSRALDRDDDHRAKNNPIMVFATGNNGLNQASLQARAGYLRQAYRRWLIAVAAIDRNGNETNFSNRCGVAKYYCMTALGVRLNTRERDGDSLRDGTKSGTSFSTSVVVGAMALLAEKFDGYSNQELRHRILYTARHTLPNGTRLRNREGSVVDPTTGGDCVSSTGCSDEFGNGTLRMDIALSAVGSRSTAYSSDNLKSAKRQSVKNTRLEASGAFGSGLSSALNSKTTVTYDELNAPFKTKMSSFVTGGQHAMYSALTLAEQDKGTQNIRIRNAVGLSYTTDGHANASQMGFTASNKNSVNSILGEHLQYRTNTGNINFISGFDTTDGSLMYGMERMIKVGNTTVTPLTKVIYEQNKVLGAKGSATLSTEGTSTSTFVGVTVQTKIRDFDVYAYTNYGVTHTRGEFGVSFKDLQDIQSSDFGVMLSRPFETAAYRIKYGAGFTLPLRVNRGVATVHYNTGRDTNKNLSFKTEKTSVVPTGRAKMLELFYQQDSKNAPRSLRFNILHNRDVNHTRGVNETSVGAFYTLKFNTDILFK